jgi:hypothetical protein
MMVKFISEMSILDDLPSSPTDLMVAVTVYLTLVDEPLFIQERL